MLNILQFVLQNKAGVFTQRVTKLVTRNFFVELLRHLYPSPNIHRLRIDYEISDYKGRESCSVSEYGDSLMSTGLRVANFS